MFAFFRLFSLIGACSKAWPTGKVEGLRARGGFVFDIAWKDGKLTSLKIVSTQGAECRLSCGAASAAFKTAAGRTYTRNGRLE
jgi:alpha-L-fucosidase 2